MDGRRILRAALGVSVLILSVVLGIVVAFICLGICILRLLYELKERYPL